MHCLQVANSKVLTLGLVTALVLAPVANPRAWAQTTASPSPSPSVTLTADDFEAACGPILTQAPPTHATDLDIYNQKLPICQGAKSAHEAMKDQGLLWKVWTGVSVVCAAACGASFFGMGSQYICIGTNLAAGVTEGVVTEDFSAAMSGIMGAGSSFLINSVMSGGKDEEAAKAGAEAAKETAPADANTSDAADKAKPKAESKKDIGACLSSLMAAGQAVSKHGSAKSAEETLDAAMQELSSLVSINNAAALPGSVSISTGDTTQSSAVGTQTSATGTGEGVANVDTPSSSCSGSVSTTGEAVVCAAAMDDGLPGFIRDPKFQKEFEKGAREPFGEFLGRSGESIGQAISGAMDGVLTSPAVTRVEAAVDELAATLASRDYNVAGTLYGSGGGRRRSGGAKGGDDDMMSQMAGLMGQLLPGGKKKDGAADRSVEALARVQKAQQGRSPASLSEDRGLSLFDRVTVRYLILNKSDRVGVLLAPAATAAPGSPNAGGGMR